MTTRLTYQTLLQRLEKLKPFAFIRWGDGEIRAVMGDTQPNCDGHDRDMQLRDALMKVLKLQDQKQTLYMGYQSSHHSKAFRPMIESRYPGVLWSNADILHDASIEGVLEDFFEILSCHFDQGVKSMLISGNEKIYRIADIDTFISLKSPNSYYQHKVEELSDHIRRHNPQIVLFAASMASNVWIQALWEQFPDKIFIDVGSVLDPYAGVVSRAYHWQIVKRLGIAKKDLIITGSQSKTHHNEQ